MFRIGAGIEKRLTGIPAYCLRRNPNAGGPIDFPGTVLVGGKVDDSFRVVRWTDPL
ncbi:MAG: hypothetical protein Ct9H300mP8_04530 [Gammaproteobacteria bacterium]|nr:MAG: hypothetical protein Ct9H300mP8_04530 [Gammaproteobacteria bacterium]